MSSSDNSDLFNQTESNEEEDDQNFEEPPAYTQEEEFKQFVQTENIKIDKYGYIYVHVYKPFYFPGEIIRGSIILDLFNPLPKKYNEIKLRFYGFENVGKHYENVKESLKR